MEAWDGLSQGNRAGIAGDGCGEDAVQRTVCDDGDDASSCGREGWDVARGIENGVRVAERRAMEPDRRGGGNGDGDAGGGFQGVRRNAPALRPQQTSRWLHDRNEPRASGLEHQKGEGCAAGMRYRGDLRRGVRRAALGSSGVCVRCGWIAGLHTYHGIDMNVLGTYDLLLFDGDCGICTRSAELAKK